MKKLLVLFLFIFMVTGCVASPITVQVANDVSGNVEQDIGDSTTVTNPQQSYQPEVENGRWIWGALFTVLMVLVIGFVMHYGIESAVTKEEYYDNKQWKP